MININRDVNPEFLNRCRVLDEYSIFIDTVNYNRILDMGYSEAIESAIQKCISENILKEFLLARGNEVLEVMTLDYTWKRREQLIRRDGHAEGLTEGLIKGHDELLVEQICKKLQKGKTISVIADELEEDTSTIHKYVDVALKFAPEYDVEKIIDAL